MLLFRWEFTGSEEEAAKSIPYQLQKLFLHLQVFWITLFMANKICLSNFDIVAIIKLLSGGILKYNICILYISKAYWY